LGVVMRYTARQGDHRKRLPESSGPRLGTERNPAICKVDSRSLYCHAAELPRQFAVDPLLQLRFAQHDPFRAECTQCRPRDHDCGGQKGGNAYEFGVSSRASQKPVRPPYERINKHHAFSQAAFIKGGDSGGIPRGCRRAYVLAGRIRKWLICWQGRVAEWFKA